MIGRNLLKSLKSITDDWKYYDTIWQQIYLSDWFDPFYKAYKWLTDWSRLQRFFFWGWNMRYSWDWDAHTVYDMLHLKYKRTYKV